MEVVSDSNKQIAPKEGLINNCTIFPRFNIKFLDQICFKSSNIHNVTLTNSSSGYAIGNPMYYR